MIDWHNAAIWPVIASGAMFVTYAALWVTIRIAKRFRFIDRVNPNSGNSGGAAMGGGLVVVGVVALSGALISPDPVSLRLLLPVGLACCLGLLDDVYALSPAAKVLGQIACIGLYGALAGINPTLWVVVGPFLLVASNAWNVVDVMDGLLGWIGALCLLGVTVVFVIDGRAPDSLVVISSVSAASLLGFVIWNKYPARVLLGDAGSVPLGLLYGLLIVEGFGIDPKLGTTLIVPGVIPFFEVVLITTQRTLHRIPFYRKTPDHFALRLRRNGWPVHVIIRLVRRFGVGLASLSVVIASVGFDHAVITASFAVIAAIGVLAYRNFSRLPLNPKDKGLELQIGSLDSR